MIGACADSFGAIALTHMPAESGPAYGVERGVCCGRVALGRNRMGREGLQVGDGNRVVSLTGASRTSDSVSPSFCRPGLPTSSSREM